MLIFTYDLALRAETLGSTKELILTGMADRVVCTLSSGKDQTLL